MAVARLIYKIVTPTEWEAAERAGIYGGSAHDLRDGFIHFSTAAQLAETARKHFSGIPALLLLTVDVERLTSITSWPPSEAAIQRLPDDRLDGRVKPGHDATALRWEPSRGGDLFPHLYAPLPLSAVIRVEPLPLAENGAPLIPEVLGA